MNEVRERLGEVDGFAHENKVYRRSDSHPELWKVYRTDDLHVTTDDLAGILSRRVDDYYYSFTEVRSDTDPV